jgi:adenine-specific DNA methylase
MATKKELLAQEVAKAVGAGKLVALETVDFNDPNRPKTCLEMDFPLVQVNAIAGLEASSGALKKPIYQMSKWWARRQSSVFRSMLIAAAARAPEDPSHAAKLVWDNYYANHQKKGAFKHLKVADIFMGGGTTLVEGSRLRRFSS